MGRNFAHGHPDHDACGTGFIVRLGHSTSPRAKSKNWRAGNLGAASHEVVERGLVALERLSHRGGVDADGASGDGAGLMTEIPQDFIRRAAAGLGIALPQSFAVGMLFLPQDKQQELRSAIDSAAPLVGLDCLGWREVPIERSVLGALALKTLPAIWQCFLSHSGSENFELQLFLFRKRMESELGSDAYFCSLSSQTVVYKGLLAPWQLRAFYPDLQAPDFASRFAIFHQRFSTNTRPSWSLAQPFRLLAHNGEINTITGNRRWMQARENEIREHFGAGEWLHALQRNVSDSASLDNALEILLRQDRSIEAGMLTLVPPAFESDSQLSPEVRRYLESASLNYEPWDGPAALVFSDGKVVGAKLDRNGLRPLRYQRTLDGWLIAGSEAGLGEWSDTEVIERQRLGPGEMLVVDLNTGTLLRNGELLQKIAAHGKQKSFAQPRCLPSVKGPKIAVTGEPRRIAAALGWSEDQIRFLLQPLAEGKEAMWSMGDDTPPAFMSRMRRTLWDYCKQRFAQVTNPPIDPLREAHVMSLRTRIGLEFVSDSPLLSGPQLKFMQECFTPCRRVDITFPTVQGITGAHQAIERIRSEVRAGESGRRLVILSDRRTDHDRAALPVLLATSAAWQAMAQAGNYRLPLVVETAQVVETHHVALLLAVGATAVCPFLAMQMAEEHHANGAANYCNAANAGLRKVLSRMGISSVSSYRNAQLFEVVGLDAKLCETFLESAERFVEVTSLDEILADYLHNHALAFASEQDGMRDAGLYRYRKEGEIHATFPELMRKLHRHTRAQEDASYSEFEELAGQREPVAIRDLLTIRSEKTIDVTSVEPETEILRRFSTQAMSVGAISPEAHRTLALAMNRLGARSNTGEGGEDPALHRREPEAANKIKQVASGRFGVTAEYLVHAEELEIKMAQGSKPGEGGQLPASKVSEYIAKLRHTTAGVALISPPPHHDIYSIEDLEQLIHDLREINPEARIGVKLVSGAGVGIIAAGVAKAGANVITISGHDGGTGASPLSSIKNTGLPWEFGLRDAHRTLVEAGLRSHVRLRVDGGLKFARDVMTAALLGADEFGFGTAALLAIGCVMARQCHLNTCPVGIATQDESLRTRFAGNPEMVMAYFRGLASELRRLLASIGATTLEEIVGHAEYLQARKPESSGWVENLLQTVSWSRSETAIERRSKGLACELSKAVTRKSAGAKKFSIRNSDRSVGANLSGELLRRSSKSRHELDFEFTGAAGQSFGAFLVNGIRFRLSGEANDYVGKGLSGGSIAITAGSQASLRGDVLAGNTVLYGATSGELYVAGMAGERFAVRNSGALAVVEGVGNHGCEYMTGGIALILGPTGKNLGSGMTGGLIYLQSDYFSEPLCNLNFIRSAACSQEEENALRQVLRRHWELTGSPRAAALLDARSPLPFTRLQPLQLPCPIEQTWASVLKRLPIAATPEQAQQAFEAPALVSTGVLLEDLQRVSAD